MKLRLILLGVILLLIAGAVLAGIAWYNTPRLVEMIPAAQAQEVAPGSPVRVTFSQPMDHGSLEEHLSFSPTNPGTFTWEGSTLIFNPASPWPSGQTITVTLESGARPASWLAFPARGQSWVFTIGQTLIAYLWPADAPADIYTLDPLSGMVRQLTLAVDVSDFSLDRTGQVIYFTASNQNGGTDLYRLDRSHLSGVSLLLECGQPGCQSPAVSADGRYLAYEYLMPGTRLDSGPVQVWVMDLTTGQVARVGDEGHNTSQPSWSASGLLAFYDLDTQAYMVYSQPGGAVRSFPNLTAQPLTWDPDGQSFVAPEIIYIPVGVGQEIGSSRLLRYDLGSGTSFDLTVAEDVEDRSPLYSPDGTRLAFARKYLDPVRWTPGRQLWVMNMDGSSQIQLTDAPFYNSYDFAWSPDGAQIAYVRFNNSKPTDPPELWLVNADGSNPIQLVIGGYAPQWIP